MLTTSKSPTTLSIKIKYIFFQHGSLSQIHLVEYDRNCNDDSMHQEEEREFCHFIFSACQELPS